MCTFYRTRWEHACILNVLSTLVISVEIVPASVMSDSKSTPSSSRSKKERLQRRREWERASCAAERLHNSSRTHTKLSMIWLSWNIYVYTASSRWPPKALHSPSYILPHNSGVNTNSHPFPFHYRATSTYTPCIVRHQSSHKLPCSYPAANSHAWCVSTCGLVV